MKNDKVKSVENLSLTTSSEPKESLTKNLESKYSPTVIQGATAKILKLFAELKSEYGDLFEYKKHRFTPARAREWAVEILEAGINADQFNNGRYLAIYRQKYPIERSFEFIELCLSAARLNYPDVRTAYIDAANHRWDEDGILYEAARLVGLSAMREQEDRYTYPLFQKHYKDVITAHSQGAVYKVMQVPQIEVKKESQGCDEATADYYLAKIRALLSENDNDK